MADLFPDSVHPRDIGLKATDDRVIWDYARDNGLLSSQRIRTSISEAFCLATRRKSFG